jgi:glutathione S-transferase
LSEIILHHYPRSPFSEKVRLAFGFKGVAWKSVIIPRLMPKPELMPLTGGYRKTPVMQIGADIYCDTQCILRELERRFPQPTLFPFASEGVASATAAWADSVLFIDVLGVVFGMIGDKLPSDIKDDRAKMTEGSAAPWDAERMKADLPRHRDRLRAHLGWIAASLAGGKPFLLGAAPSLADFAVYHPIWFLRGNLEAALPEASYRAIRPWLERMDAIGHGRVEEMTAQEALAIAKAATPATGAAADPDDPNGRKLGESVTISADDYGRDPVTGVLVAGSAQEIVIRRSDPLVGEVMLHFPRSGFVLDPA